MRLEALQRVWMQDCAAPEEIRIDLRELCSLAYFIPIALDYCDLMIHDLRRISLVEVIDSAPLDDTGDLTVAVNVGADVHSPSGFATTAWVGADVVCGR